MPRFLPPHPRRLLSILPTLPLLIAASDIHYDDFERSGHGAWHAEGEAFGNGPATTALPNQSEVSGFHGRHFLTSYHGGDETTGTLTSPEFELSRDYIRFLIGGGGFPGKTCFQLLLNGIPVRESTGKNTLPGGSERLEPAQWDVREFRGKTVSLRAVDRATGGWGHINLDQIILTDVPLVDLTRHFLLTKRYINLPINHSSPLRKMEILLDGHPHTTSEMHLAEGEPDYWVFLDSRDWQGRGLTLMLANERQDSRLLESAEMSDTPREHATIYRESLRPQFHFSARRGWINDPNGLVYHNGVYHLFFQHNPYDWNWGNMHWGHAVSPDLVHWDEQPEALAPDILGTMFSGSAILDRHNSSGLGTADHPPLILAYTASGRESSQCLASSADGLTFVKYAGNPVIPQITPGNRDPKLLWHEPSRKWIMALYGQQMGSDGVNFHTSDDLKSWHYASRHEGIFECPELFELPLEDHPQQRMWVLTGADGDYFLGHFDGKTFLQEGEKHQGPRGKHLISYAAQNFNNLPASDHRVIQLAWLRAPMPGMPFNNALSLPRSLSLRRTPDGPQLVYQPVEELKTLRIQSQRISLAGLSPATANPLANIATDLVELRISLIPGAAQSITLNLGGPALVYRGEDKKWHIQDEIFPALPEADGRLELTLYRDRSLMEIFAARGLVLRTILLPPRTDSAAPWSLEIEGGSIREGTLEIHELKSAWPKEE